MRKYIKGVVYFEWDAKKKHNEALDCRVYALTAVRTLQQHRGLNLERLAEQRPEPQDLNAVIKAIEPIEPTPRQRRRSRSPYLDR